MRDVPRGFTRTIGALEILGAAGLALLQVLATLFHVTRREWRNLPVNAVLVALALVAACGRFVVVPF